MVGISELFKISMNKHEISRRLVYNKAIFAKVKIWLNLVGGQKVLAAGKYLVSSVWSMIIRYVPLFGPKKGNNYENI